VRLKRYEQPLPSREYILQILEEQGRPVGFDELCLLLDIEKTEFDPFQRRLRAMEREAQLLRNRKGAYLLPERASLIAGRVEGHPDGYGFLIPDDGSEDLSLEARQMSKVLHRDRALVRVVGIDRRGRREGVIVEVLERANSRVVGRVLLEHGITVVVSRKTGASTRTSWWRRTVMSARAAGEVVTVEIIEQPDRHSKPIGRIVEVLGNYADPGMEIEIALRKHELPFEFSPAALAEAAALPEVLDPAEWQGRTDLRSLPLVTIDGETARDFDDAVFAEKGRGWRLVVAIADVSHYVQPGTALDREARERGNSVYFPRRVIPMLPEKLSNGLCSLNPDVERLAMVCDMTIDAQAGEISDYRFYRGGFPLARAADLRPGVALAGGVTPPESDVDRSPAAAVAGALRPLQGARRGARQARRDRLRNDRDDDAVQRPGQDREHRSGAPQRRPPHDRGVHAGRQRLCLGLSPEPAAAVPVPDSRRADGGEARAAAQLPQGVRHRPRRR
jgi:ribonuclease R